MSSASALLPGLPFIFLTQDQHIIPTSVIQQAATIPPGIHPRKCYYTTQVDVIKQELEEAKSLGAAAAEEWFKGLEAQGKARISDAERCERWETTRVPQATLNEYVTSPPPVFQPFTPHHPASVPMDPRGWTAPSGQAAMYSPAPAAAFHPPAQQYSSVNQYPYQPPPCMP